MVIVYTGFLSLVDEMIESQTNHAQGAKPATPIGKKITTQNNKVRHHYFTPVTMSSKILHRHIFNIDSKLSVKTNKYGNVLIRQLYDQLLGLV